MTKSILVTGGAGFIGSHTVVELVAAGYRPVIIDNFSNSKRKAIKQLETLTKTPITYYELDYQDDRKLAPILRKEKISGVIHFAAYKGVDESIHHPIKYYQNNVAGLTKFLEQLEKHGIPNFVFSSSCTVYGEPDKLPITESTPTKPANTPYGSTKKMGEVIIEDTAHVSSSLKALSLRYFNPIGGHPSAVIGEDVQETPANLIPYLVQAVAGLREPLVIHGDDYQTPDGTCVRDYIHVVDVAKAHIKALEYLESQKAGTYEFCNIGTGKGSSVLEVIKTFEDVTGKKVPYTVGPRRAGDIINIYASAEKAHKLLGWKTELTLPDALEDAWRWQQSLV